MMDIRSIEQGGTNIVIKGKMMGAMAATLIVTPEGLWEGYRLFPASLLLKLPALLYKGWRASKRAN